MVHVWLLLYSLFPLYTDLDDNCVNWFEDLEYHEVSIRKEYGICMFRKAEVFPGSNWNK